MTPAGLLVLSRTDVARLMDFADYVDAVEAGFRAAVEGQAAGAARRGLPRPERLLPRQGCRAAGGRSPKWPSSSTATSPAIRRPTACRRCRASSTWPTAPMVGRSPDGFDRNHHQPHRRGHHAGGPPSGAPRLARGDDLRRGRAGPHPARGDRGGGQARTGACLGYQWPGGRDDWRTRCRPRSSSTCGPRPTSRSRGRATSSSPCTSARRAFLTPELVRPGTFISAVGADNSDKHEDRSPRSMRRACRSSIRWSRPRRSATCTMRSKPAPSPARTSTPRLGEILAGTKPGRTDAQAITLFDSTGMGLQDVAAAVAIYRRALEAGAGTRLSLT